MNLLSIHTPSCWFPAEAAVTLTVTPSPHANTYAPCVYSYLHRLQVWAFLVGISISSVWGYKLSLLISSKYEHWGIIAQNDRLGNSRTQLLRRWHSWGRWWMWVSGTECFSGEKVRRGARLVSGLCYPEGFSNSTLLVSKSYIFRHLRLMTCSLLQTCIKYIIYFNNSAPFCFLCCRFWTKHEWFFFS